MMFSDAVAPLATESRRNRSMRLEQSVAKRSAAQGMTRSHIAPCCPPQQTEPNSRPVSGLASNSGFAFPCILHSGIVNPAVSPTVAGAASVWQTLRGMRAELPDYPGTRMRPRHLRQRQYSRGLCTISRTRASAVGRAHAATGVWCPPAEFIQSALPIDQTSGLPA